MTSERPAASAVDTPGAPFLSSGLLSEAVPLETPLVERKEKISEKRKNQRGSVASWHFAQACKTTLPVCARACARTCGFVRVCVCDDDDAVYCSFLECVLERECVCVCVLHLHL